MLSDPELPPARAWQCKNHKKIDWDDCRDLAVPRRRPTTTLHLTTPSSSRRPLTGPQRNFWCNKFHPATTRALSRPRDPRLLRQPRRAPGRPARSHQPAQRGRTRLAPPRYRHRRQPDRRQPVGVHPRPDRRRSRAGAPRCRDRSHRPPRYRDEHRQREARAEDRTIPEGRVRFGFEALICAPTGVHRHHSHWRRRRRRRRPSRVDDVSLDQVMLWFSDTTEGAARRDYIRRRARRRTTGEPHRRPQRRPRRRPPARSVRTAAQRPTASFAAATSTSDCPTRSPSR